MRRIRIMTHIFGHDGMSARRTRFVIDVFVNGLDRYDAKLWLHTIYGCRWPEPAIPIQSRTGRQQIWKYAPQAPDEGFDARLLISAIAHIPKPDDQRSVPVLPYEPANPRWQQSIRCNRTIGLGRDAVCCAQYPIIKFLACG